MEKYDVELLPASYADLDQIFDYILVDDPHAAERTLDKIMNALRHLEYFPLSGAPLHEPSLNKFNFRLIIVGPYIAIYRFIADKIFVYRIVHGARNYPDLLKDTLDRT